MKKIALFLLGFGTLVAVSVSAATTDVSTSQEPQNVVVCQPEVCPADSCVQVPCNQPVPCDAAVPCATDTVCTTTPCAPVAVACPGGC